MCPRGAQRFGKLFGAVRVSCLIVAFALSACSGGGGGSSPAAPTAPTTVQKVSGTLEIVSSPATTALLRGALAREGALARHGARPLFVSASTGDVHLFIDGGAAPSGSLTTCSAATGTGTGCTLSWTTALAVPASHIFAVEIDTGTTHTPNNTVLAEGSGSYVLVAGSNTTLTPALSLNAVVTSATFTTTSCTATTCSGNVVLAAAGGNAIAYTGGTAVPTYGQSPTSGNVFDNSGVSGASNVTLTSSAAATGTVTGIAQTPFSTFTAPTLTIAGVNTNGTYTYSVGCVASATGTFGITVGGGATPSLDVTAAELSGLSPAVTYPASGVVTNATAPSFTCTSGNISSATGTLPVN
jgi:hypothetical protein